MNKKDAAILLKQTKTRDERQDLLDELINEYPDITIKECMELGFSYGEIIFG